jgi:filamentous hemagglutinin
MDGWLEQQALKQAALRETGQATFIVGLAYDEASGLSVDSQQRALLYENAARFATNEEIRLGVALSEEQQAKLAEPMLWYVEESVTGPDGKAYTALAPRLYLPQGQLGQWANVAGGVIRGNDVTLDAGAGRIENTGYVVAANTLSIDAGELVNRARSAAWGSFTMDVEGGLLEVWGDRVQPGGFLSAAKLDLDVGRVTSISGEFLEGGRDISGELAGHLGSDFSRSENRDNTYTLFHADESIGLEQLVIMAVAIAVSIYTAGAASEALYWGMAESGLASTTSIATLETLAAAGAGAAGAMAGNATAQMLATGNLDVGNVLRSGLGGGISGGLSGYYGESWSFDRVAANSIAGGVSSELNGGQFEDGFKMAFITSLARYGWDYTRQATDDLKTLACNSEGNPCLPDERGQIRTDGARDVDWLSHNPNKEGNWLTNSGMAEEGSGKHWYDPGGPLENKYLRYFVTDVSKMHDWLNSWSYNPANGFYMSQGTTFDSLFQLYSFAGMPIAGALTAFGYLSLPPYNQIFTINQTRKSQ